MKQLQKVSVRVVVSDNRVVTLIGATLKSWPGTKSVLAWCGTLYQRCCSLVIVGGGGLAA